MDDGEDDSRYSPKAYDVDNQQGLGSSVRSNQKHPAYNEYVDDEEEDVEDEELAEGDEGVNGLRVIGKDNYDDDGEDDDDEEDDTDDDNDEDEDDDGTRPRKKRKLKNLISNYEFAPRLPASAPAASAHQDAPSRASSGRRNAGADWTERETFVLLDAWGERFLKLGRKSLRLEDWQEVAERVSQETNIERTDTQCRNRLDTLKKNYRREKMKLEAAGEGCKWPFYRKMDMMLNPPPQQLRTSLSCGVDSGEYVFTDPKAYLNRANGLDEMRDSPGNSESWKDNGENISDGLPPNGKRNRGSRVGGSFRLLAESIEKFSEIYEKIEISKRKQMVELESMRMDFHRQLETQRRQILERAQAEIVKIRQGGEEDNDNDLSADD